MKSLLISSIFQFLAFLSLAQVPQQFSFQGVARDASGKVVANKAVSVRISVLQNTLLGPTVYRETHKPQTSSGGVFTIAVGGGSQEVGKLDDVEWNNGPYYLQVELDPTGGSNYINTGSSQLLSVPYAIQSLQAEVANKLRDNYPIVHTGSLSMNELPTLQNLSSGNYLIWYPKKASFRAGLTENDEWNHSNMGIASTAFGRSTKALGDYSTAMGAFSEALGHTSFAAGFKAKANALNSIAFGPNTLSSGNQSTAIGSGSQALGPNSISIGSSSSKGNASIVIGRELSVSTQDGIALGAFNDDNDNPDDPFPLKRLFQIGNGLFEDRSNALTILRNGNIGIGKNALSPQYILDIDGRPRLRHNGATSGLFFNTSQQQPNAFMGMKTDEQLGFFIAGEWRFWVDNNGNAKISGASYNTSDRRLKRDFTQLSNTLSKLTNLKGYHYYWKSSTADQGLQTGLIAQEVEELFPELVSTDKEGFKAVNYIGLIPHLIEAMKELKAKVDRLEADNNR